jgi:hypothetical protein
MNRPNEKDIKGWMQYVQCKILNKPVVLKKPIDYSALDMFHFTSLHYSTKMRLLEYKKTIPYPQNASPDPQIDPLEKENRYYPQWINEQRKRHYDENRERMIEIGNLKQEIEQNELFDEIEEFASTTAGQAWRDPAITVELMEYLTAWLTFLNNGKANHKYGLKYIVGMELGVFLSRNKRFPGRKELVEILHEKRTEISPASMNDALDYYEVGGLVRDNYKG